MEDRQERASGLQPHPSSAFTADILVLRRALLVSILSNLIWSASTSTVFTKLDRDEVSQDRARFTYCKHVATGSPEWVKLRRGYGRIPSRRYSIKARPVDGKSSVQRQCLPQKPLPSSLLPLSLPVDSRSLAALTGRLLHPRHL